jgi:hypothetical protein
MPRAVLVLADLYPGSGALPDLTAIPRLPALESCLARADSERLVDADWRRWLCRRLGVQLPSSATAPGYWLATPVHYVAGLDTLRLHGDGLLRLPLPAQQRLVEDFGRVFGGSGWQLIATDARELRLQGPSLEAEAPDPARFLGQSTREALPRGAGMETLRRLQSEIEMWLHGTDFHSGTATRLKANGLWLWGRLFAGTPAQRAAYAGARRGVTGGHLYADDLGARGCAAAAGMTLAARPERWPDDAHRDCDQYVVLNITGMNVTWQLEQLVRDWVEPAIGARAAGRFATLELVCAGRRWILDDAARWRFWRRRRHWLPELLAC